MKIGSPSVVEMPEEVLSNYFSNKYSDFLKISDDRYFYWEEIKQRKKLPYNDPTKAWNLIKLHRGANCKRLEFGKNTFSYCLTDTIQQALHGFDLKLIGELYKTPITALHKAEYLKNSILEEAIASSQVEGAATTKVALKMLKSGRNPRDESKQMIFNNLRSINLITEIADKPLDFALIISLHRTMTANTKAEYCAGDFRNTQIYIQDHVDGEIAHTPPNAKLMNSYMRDLWD